MSKYNEEETLIRLQDPKTQTRAFEEIVNHYSQPLYWQIRRLVVDHEDADDVLQNTFIKAWTNITSFRGESKLSTWLYKIAYNESLTFLNHKREQLSIDDLNSMTMETLESDPYFDGDETQLMLQEAINTLPDKQKAVFNMKYFEEMKYEDMSQITGTSVGALKASFHLAVKKIEEYFNNRD
ncbi:MAG: RNA polymerase sigma factor [Bacteroidaceae bacterium]|jgi:RNA polymerase sigma-70 factor (ECF subfamily)|nr:RNA polymerase sigma factor [Bacteroidaceae bacterium]MBR6893989.1 RNA polymerase sigma factor [Bacteroidaceae bacterium]